MLRQRSQENGHSQDRYRHCRGGQAGLAMSYCLKRQQRRHIVLERAPRVAKCVAQPGLGFLQPKMSSLRQASTSPQRSQTSLKKFLAALCRFIRWTVCFCCGWESDLELTN